MKFGWGIRRSSELLDGNPQASGTVEAADIPLQGGDIVTVSAQTFKQVPYRFFSTVVNVGASIHIR